MKILRFDIGNAIGSALKVEVWCIKNRGVLEIEVFRRPRHCPGGCFVTVTSWEVYQKLTERVIEESSKPCGPPSHETSKGF